MARVGGFYTRRGERGITMTFVVVAMFALLGMAALAIDLVTLYVARAQAQRIADAAALAGAKTLVDHGLTADPTDAKGTLTASCVQARSQAIVIANRGRIGGVAPATVTPCFPNGGACNATCPAPGGVGTGFGVNPQVAVTVRSAVLPLFFAKLWGHNTATVSAKGQAEGFNPSATDIPVAAKCVTPWMIPNRDPVNGGPIFNQGNGQMSNVIPSTTGVPAGFIGERIQLSTGCPAGCATPNPPTSSVGPPARLTYYPLDLPNPAASGPSCSVGATYHQNIAACNPTPIACGTQVNLDTTGNPNDVPNNQQAIDCLIGASGPGLANGQDDLVATSFPYEINAGTTHPSVATGTEVSTSRSVVTIPIYDLGGGAAPGSPVTVIGFAQAFVLSADSVTGEPTIQILNVSGCSAAARASAIPPVGLNGSSSVPVRLIQP